MIRSVVISTLLIGLGGCATPPKVEADRPLVENVVVSPGLQSASDSLSKALSQPSSGATVTIGDNQFLIGEAYFSALGTTCKQLVATNNFIVYVACQVDGAWMINESASVRTNGINQI